MDCPRCKNEMESTGSGGVDKDKDLANAEYFCGTCQTYWLWELGKGIYLKYSEEKNIRDFAGDTPDI
jgi:transcription elongation factor Elf1